MRGDHQRQLTRKVGRERLRVDAAAEQKHDPGTLADSSPSQDAIVTVTFVEEGGVTTVTTLIDVGSKEARDAVATGMTDGMEQSYVRLERLFDEHSRA